MGYNPNGIDPETVKLNHPRFYSMAQECYSTVANVRAHWVGGPRRHLVYSRAHMCRLGLLSVPLVNDRQYLSGSSRKNELYIAKYISFFQSQVCAPRLAHIGFRRPASGF